MKWNKKKKKKNEKKNVNHEKKCMDTTDQDSDGTWITPDNEQDSGDTVITPKNDEDSEGEWITPENVLQQDFDIWGKYKPKEKKVWSSVACVTTDYAMQNVLLQMGIRLMNVSGYNIRKIRYYIMKCHSCFTTTRDMFKKFCPSCGNHTLLKCTIHVSDNGKVFYKFPKWKMFNLRGTNRTIPRPKGGRVNNDLLLREPDPGWRPWKVASSSHIRKGLLKKKKKKIDPFESCLEFGMQRVGVRGSYAKKTYGHRKIGPVTGNKKNRKKNRKR